MQLIFTLEDRLHCKNWNSIILDLCSQQYFIFLQLHFVNTAPLRSQIYTKLLFTDEDAAQLERVPSSKIVLIT